MLSSAMERVENKSERGSRGQDIRHAMINILSSKEALFGAP
jgi:hypothetical protein